MKLTFWGAAGTVTGSLHQLEFEGKRYVLDCGMYQGRRKEAEERNRHFPFQAAAINGVILSHAHIDHSGNLPLLVKNGFNGPIHTTAASADLCNAMLRDTAHILEEDANFIRKRHEEPVEPLYTEADAEKTFPLFQPVPYYTPSALDANISYEFSDAGHILGSAVTLFRCRGNGTEVRLAYSGDVGRPGLPIIRDPDALPATDYLILESTYGGRFHEHTQTVADKLAEVITRTCGRGGRIIVPAFAVGRTQQLVFLLHGLANAGRIPNVPIFVDSPLAVNVTDVHRRHPECFNPETRKYLESGEDPFGFSRLHYVRDVNESKKLNRMSGSFVVISASGMCENGRILHHLQNNIEDSRNTVLITGFQAENTLGRKLVEKWPEVRIFGQPVRVRAEIVALDALSGHADHGELLAWIKPVGAQLKKVFLVHGEPEPAQDLAKAIQAELSIETVIAAPGASFDLT